MSILRIWVGLIIVLAGCSRTEQPVQFEAVRAPAPVFPHPDSTTHLTGEQLAYRYCQTCHALDRKSTRLNSSHSQQSRMPSSA